MTRFKTALPHFSMTAVHPLRYLKWTALAVGATIGLMVLWPFPHYFVADLDYGFLKNKGAFFYSSGYYIGFYIHIIGAPLAFFLGTLQVSRTVRLKWPLCHRWMGRLYCCSVLLLAAPGGLVMAFRAYGGWSSTLCFMLLAILTWVTTAMGWRAVRSGAYRQHAIWMIRSYLLIASAIFLRMFYPVITSLGMDHEFTYQVSVWASWLLPLSLFEIVRAWRNRAPSMPLQASSD